MTQGWTGRRCGPCKGTGEQDDQSYGRLRCNSCGGTGDEWADLPDAGNTSPAVQEPPDATS